MLLGVEFIVFSLVAVWLIVLSWQFKKLHSHYNALIGSSTNKSLLDTLNTLIQEVGEAKKVVGDLVRRCDRIESEGRLHIQKVGLLRFNPFKDTGGDQSFILALVDAHDTGIVISGLYSRSGTRWYAKKVIQGRGIEHELTDDEKKAIHIAKIAA